MLDENVDVIYVTSLPINEETLQYYLKLLGLRSAVETGKAENQTDFSHRYKIVIPEALHKFPVSPGKANDHLVNLQVSINHSSL